MTKTYSKVLPGQTEEDYYQMLVDRGEMTREEANGQLEYIHFELVPDAEDAATKP
jgi:hypothetical protein